MSYVEVTIVDGTGVHNFIPSQSTIDRMIMFRLMGLLIKLGVDNSIEWSTFGT